MTWKQNTVQSDQIIVVRKNNQKIEFLSSTEQMRKKLTKERNFLF